MELRDTVQRLVDNATAGADSWKRCEWKQFTDTMYDQVADYLNNIEEVACGLSCKELIETPIWPEDILITPVTNIKKGAESPRPRDVRPIALASRPLLRMVEHKIQRSGIVGQKGMAPQNCARRNLRFQSAKCHLATTVEDGIHDKR